MSRFARDRQVLFFEEPVFEDEAPHLRQSICEKSGVRVCTPVLPPGFATEHVAVIQEQLLRSVLQEQNIEEYSLWYYTPMALTYTSSLRPVLTIYDCMDELSAFAGAPSAMRENEQRLFQLADLVFTGGASLYASKCNQHPSVHLFPSSVDVAHFRRAREISQEPEDQSGIAHPRLGYAGVIDERMDLDLLRTAAEARPSWQFVFIGPVVKIDPALLPRNPNIHYLGLRPYSELPAYFSGWEIGMLPFALNESTRFISPTKTPEYLAAGLPVISTPIRDVVSPYGDLGLVRIANGHSEFLSEADSMLNSPLSIDFVTRVDRFLSQFSWDKTWREMNELMKKTLTLKRSQIARSASLAAVPKGASHV